MATKRSEFVEDGGIKNSSVTSENDEVFMEESVDLPPEFDGVPTSPERASAPSSTTVSLAELTFTNTNTAKRDELERAKLDPPIGDWEKNDRWESRVSVIESDSMPGDVYAGGRIVVTVWGKPKPRTKLGLEYEPTIRIRFSPDIRHRPDDVEKIDSSYKIYLLTKDLYLALNGRKVESVGDMQAQLQALESMLVEESYVVNTTVFNNSLFTQGLKVKMVRR